MVHDFTNLLDERGFFFVYLSCFCIGYKDAKDGEEEGERKNDESIGFTFGRCVRRDVFGERDFPSKRRGDL